MSASLSGSASPSTVAAGAESIISLAVQNTGASALSIRDVRVLPVQTELLVRGGLNDVDVVVPVGQTVTVRLGVTFSENASNGVQGNVFTSEGELLPFSVSVTVT